MVNSILSRMALSVLLAAGVVFQFVNECSLLLDNSFAFLSNVKLLHWLFVALFLTCAYFQWNDLDRNTWLIYYLLAAIFSFLSIFGYTLRKLVKIALLCFIVFSLVWGAKLFPGAWELVQEDPDLFLASMNPNNPGTEVAREFLGVFLTVVILLFQNTSAPN